ncbi:MAG TPA: DUF167 domain-containing protein [Burkholderiales bacterium]|nr:DUF167 domain-containing protein [Burkholderiales bacterium]
MHESWYHFDADRGLLTLFLHVQPNARRTEVAGLHGGHLKIRIAAPAVEDRANELLVGFLADRFELPGGRVMIRRGSHGRTKTVEIYDQAACLLARVKELLHS